MSLESGKKQASQFRLVVLAKLYGKFSELDIFFNEVEEIHDGAMFRLATGLPFEDEFGGKLFQMHGFVKLVIDLGIGTLRFQSTNASHRSIMKGTQRFRVTAPLHNR